MSRKTKKIAGRVILYLLVILITVIVLAPLVWMFICSISTKADLIAKLDGMLENVEYISERSPEIIAEYKAKLREKIQDLLVDSKVSRNARDSMLMAAIGSEVLWILPDPHFSGEREKQKGRFSQKYQISDTTERVLLIELGESM